MAEVELGGFSGPFQNPEHLKTLDGGQMSPKKEVSHSGGQARTSAHSAPPPPGRVRLLRWFLLWQAGTEDREGT